MQEMWARDPYDKSNQKPAKIRGYWYDCKCGYEMLITKEDIEAHDRDKLKYLEKRDG